MNRMVIGGAIAGGLMVGAAALVIGAGVAKASPGYNGSVGDHNAYAFAAELWPDGVSGTGPQARSLALDVCGKRALGISEDSLVTGMTQTYSTWLAVDVVLGAEYHFCPAYATTHNNRVSPPMDSDVAYDGKGGHHK